MNRISALRCSLLVLLVASTLGGCSWFHHRNDYYTKAAETRPLDVPPDLDTPVTSNELIVPAASATGATTSATASSSVAPPSASLAASASSGATTTFTGDGLHVADSPEHTWQRVGLALERAQVGTISARDESSRSYTVEVAGLGEPAPAAEEHHWYTRVLHPFGGGGNKAKAPPVSGHLTVRVAEDKSGAKVSVEGDSSDSATATAARRVLEVLRERLS